MLIKWPSVASSGNESPPWGEDGLEECPQSQISLYVCHIYIYVCNADNDDLHGFFSAFTAMLSFSCPFFLPSPSFANTWALQPTTTLHAPNTSQYIPNEMAVSFQAVTRCIMWPTAMIPVSRLNWYPFTRAESSLYWLSYKPGSLKKNASLVASTAAVHLTNRPKPLSCVM